MGAPDTSTQPVLLTGGTEVPISCSTIGLALIAAAPGVPSGELGAGLDPLSWNRRISRLARESPLKLRVAELAS